MKVESMVPEQWLPKVQEVGECLEWVGAWRVPKTPGSKSQAIARLVESGTNNELNVRNYLLTLNYPDEKGKGPALMVCGNSKCVSPEHSSSTHGDVGRLLYIRERTEIVGDHELWRGKVGPGDNPQYTSYTNGVPNSRSTRRFVYNQNSVKPVPDDKIIQPNCGEQLCIKFDHLSVSSGPARRRHQPVEVPWECERGHGADDINVSMAAKFGCDVCRRDDAKQFMRDNPRSIFWAYYD